ncbi:MAG TPA: hypothetical protein VGQ62_08650 [Chloroflexota bacterium]|jgi:hypothetical protein|nr:hypothetical protein [Chloroflexota bacterium]
MRLWVDDFKFHLAKGLRCAGIALAAVAWASVLGAEAQQSADVRTLGLTVSAIVAVVIAQLFTGLPPSASVIGIVRSMERDIVTAARERAGGDSQRLQELVARISSVAAVRISRTGKVPSDRRAWLRALAGLATQG